MKTITVGIGLALALVLPATAAAKPTPSQEDRRAAKVECKLLRGKTAATREGFRTLYRSFAGCVRAKAAEEAREEQTARRNAAKQCVDDRETLGPEGFANEYGTNGNKKNAFGKCVSKKARENEAEADAQDRREALALKNAAKECAADRGKLGAEAFANEHGANANKKSAFGKCVAKKARENETEQPTGV